MSQSQRYWQLSNNGVSVHLSRSVLSDWASPKNYVGTVPKVHAEALASNPAIADVVVAARSLTVIGQTEDGGIILGPQGWERMQTALRALEQ